MNSAELVKKITDLPTISTVANQINLDAKENRLTARSLGAIIARDPALTAKILKLANSAYYGLTRKVNTLERAVTVLGFDTIKNLALTVSVYKVFRSDVGRGFFDIVNLWHHSLGCAVAAKALAALSTPSLAEAAFLAGIIHDIGKVAMAQNLPDETAYILGMVADLGRPQSEIETEVLGFSHQKIGGLLADHWNFPAEYILAVRYHHGPFGRKLAENAGAAAITRSVFVADKVAKSLFLGRSTDPRIEKITPADLQPLGVSSRNLPAILAGIKEAYAAMAEAWEIRE